MSEPTSQVCASPHAALAGRALLSREEAARLATVFEVLASDTRLRLLHSLLRLGDPCLTDLADSVDMKPQAVSNQLRRLVDLGILVTRRHGSHAHYQVVDVTVLALLAHGLEMGAGGAP